LAKLNKILIRHIYFIGSSLYD